MNHVGHRQVVTAKSTIFEVAATIFFVSYSSPTFLTTTLGFFEQQAAGEGNDLNVFGEKFFESSQGQSALSDITNTINSSRIRLRSMFDNDENQTSAPLVEKEARFQTLK
ncbi:hypothetical protein RIF29_28282 [Crotalaria pallida]|uniref:Uncharacterized protein n=1 Tax=Crotalaria pallida TaxID=3830 RepID=A0AAN9ER47_CROPI